MPIRSGLSLAALLSTVLVAGCGDRPARPAIVDPASSPSEAQPSQPPVPKPEADIWLGQWNGPEGTFLRIARASAGAVEDGAYELTIQNLDGPRTFSAKVVGREIQFERDGVRETLRATDGAGTGMKWLAEKSDCLTVRPGEGYCRD